jgi:hypothetical protein
MDMVIEQMGTPALANSTWASMAPPSNESGAIGQLMMESKGRLLKASLFFNDTATTEIYTPASSAL